MGSAAKLIVDALLQRFIPLARRRIETTQLHDGHYFQPSDSAYEQVLDSLALVARHMPVPLLEALLRWRDIESPKGANDTSTFEKKLAVECIFCSACIRFVQCCPPEGITEKLWIGLEHFAFDWLINADRVVSQVEYPSLVDLRGLLLDLVSHLVGSLSQIRFSSVTGQFFMELSARRIDTSGARNENLSIISGMRHLRLRVKTEDVLNTSASFVAKANPLNHATTKRKSELHHALCKMLSNILAPLADDNTCHWPPSGSLTVWYEAVARVRMQIIHWADKQSKHIAAAYPLVTLLLCLGDPHVFLTYFGSHTEQLYKHLKDKNNRFMALDCLHRVTKFYLGVHGRSQPSDRVWDYLDSVTSQLLTIFRKGMLTHDLQHDKIVQLCVTIGENNLDFCVNHLILEMLKQDSPIEAKIVGLRALLDISMSPKSGQAGLEILQAQDLGHYIPKVKIAIESILRSCHRAYNLALLTSSKTTIDAITKEKSQGYLFRSVLKCIPCLIKDVGRSDRITEIIPQHGISIDHGVREEAIQVLNRIVRLHPDRRFAVVKGMMNFILRLPDESPLLIQTTLGYLLDLLRLWRSCLLDENTEHDASHAKHVQIINQRSKRSSFNHEEPIEFHASEIDAIGLIFLTSTDSQIRHTALELLRCVRDIQNRLLCEKLDLINDEAEPILMIDVFEENGDDIVQSCYWDSYRESDVAPPDATLEVMLFENYDKNRWARCLSELVKYGALLCPRSVQEAKVQITKRLALVTPVELGEKAHQVQDADYKLDQWLMYAVFACSCPPGREGSGAAATQELFRLIIPSLKPGSEAYVNAAIMALGHSHLEVCEIMFNELASFMDEISLETEGKSKWKIQKSRREELRIHISNIYRTVAENIWPGMLARKPVFRLHYLKFIDETTKLISTTSFDSFQDMQTLRYALACVLRSLAPEFVDSKSDKFDLKTRKRLFDLFLSCCDDSYYTLSQDGLSDYRREVERYKSSQHTRSKDSIDKLSFDKELSEQVEAVQWASMNCMASLLYGPCFDFDNAKKMSGRIIYWINSLFIESAPGGPFGYSPTNPRGQCHSKHNKNGVGHLRVSLAKIALKNLILTNLDLFPACIDQCYSSDADVADGYFSVLAEVYMRQEIPNCEIQRLLSLILYKVVDPSRQVRDDALQMLETLSTREWAADTIEQSGSYQVAIVGNLPDSYQQFQYKLSCKLAKDRPELSQLLCEEIMQRQLDAVDIIAQHQVLTCMTPWLENLDFWKLQNSGWMERLLKSLYYVTWRHGDQFPDEIEKLWRTIASKSRNIRPVLDFLITKGIEDCDSNASAEISGAFATYFSVAKRVSLYLARICPQGTVDHLVYHLAQRMLEDSLEPVGPMAHKSDFNGNFVLEFSQGPAIAQLASVIDNQPHMSPFLVRDSLDSLLRNTSCRTTFGGRTTSGPVIPIPHEITVARSNRRVRGSAGNSTSRHVSRDSGDYLIDASNSEADSHDVSARELNTALQGHQHQQHLLTHADIALILLAEIAYENDEDFREHLPLLFHVIFVSMDSSEDIVLEHCQQLLVNLLYSLGGRHLELYNVENTDGENQQQVVSLIKYVQSKRGTMMWENEDPTVTETRLQSAKLLSALVQSMVDAIFFQGDLRETWGAEALKWAMECTSRHLSCRSHQIYRALRPPVNHDACMSLLRCLHRCLTNPVPEVLGFIMEILLTLQVMMENVEPEKVILYPHLFWGCVAMMHTDFVHVYCQVLELFARVIDHLTFSDRTTEHILLSSMPQDELDQSVVDGEDDAGSPTGAGGTVPVFEGVQPLVLKGLMSTVSHNISIEVLSRLTIPSCDSIFGDPDTRLLMHITGLLPWLCLHINPEAVVGLGSGLGSTSPLLQQHQKAHSVSVNLAIWCEAKSLHELATVFMAYSHGRIKTIDNLLACVSPLLCNKWLPKHSVLAFGQLLNRLEKGPVEYQRVVLLILKQLLHHIPMDAVQNRHMYALISQLVESSLCCEALSVLEALLHNSNYESMTVSVNHDPAHYESDLGGVDESAFMACGGPSTESGVSAKELALQNTRLILGRVLDNCVLGRKRDYKRLVPFVNTFGNP